MSKRIAVLAVACLAVTAPAEAKDSPSVKAHHAHYVMVAKSAGRAADRAASSLAKGDVPAACYQLAKTRRFARAGISDLRFLKAHGGPSWRSYVARRLPGLEKVSREIGSTLREIGC